MEEIDKNELQKEHNTSLLFQFVVTVLIFGAGLYQQSLLICIFAVSSFFANATYFHQLVQQALSEFSEYSRTNTIKGISTIVTMLIALLLFKADTNLYYILALMFAQVITFLYCEFQFHKVVKTNLAILVSKEQTKYIFKIGIFVLLANFFRVLVGNIGQWLVQIFSNIEDFAQYSLAGSMLSVVLLVINAVAAVFYTVISKNKDRYKLLLIKNLLLIFGILSGLAYFVLWHIIGIFIPAYGASLEYMKYLIFCVPYLMVINVIATNLYKTNMNEKRYFWNMAVVLILTVLIIGIMYLFYNNPVVAAIGTALMYIIWYFFVTMKTFPFLKNTNRYNILLLTHIAVYFFSTSLSNNLMGLLMYVAYCCLILVIYKRDFYLVLAYLKENK